MCVGAARGRGWSSESHRQGLVELDLHATAARKSKKKCQGCAPGCGSGDRVEERVRGALLRPEMVAENVCSGEQSSQPRGAMGEGVLGETRRRG